jgi:hypothetical protein
VSARRTAIAVWSDQGRLAALPANYRNNSGAGVSAGGSSDLLLANTARIELLRAQIAFTSTRGSDVPPLLLEAAKRLAPLDVTLARETYLEALSAAMFAGRLAGGVGLLEVAEAARAAPPSPQPPRAADLFLDGLAVLIIEGCALGTPILQRALRAFRSDDLSRDEGLRWRLLACRTAMGLWDDEAWYELSSRQAQLARDAGALTVLPGALTLLAGIRVFAGEFAAAQALREEAYGVSPQSDNRKRRIPA